MASRKLRIGLIGAGGIASNPHAAAWEAHPDVEVTAVCDINEAAATTLAERLGAKHVFTDFKKLVKLKEVDAVDVCTPNRVHTPAVLAALTAGKHVVCEKPLAVTVKEVLQMGRLATKKRCKLMTAQHQRWTPMGKACKEFLGKDGIGKPIHSRILALRRNLLPARPGFIYDRLSGGGPCMDIGVHALDLGLWLLNFPTPVRVSGTAKTNFAKGSAIPGAWGEWDKKGFDVEDFAAGFVHFADGSTMNIEASWLLHQEESERMEVWATGMKGKISWPDGKFASVQNGVLYDTEIKCATGLPPHTQELYAFYDCVTSNKPSPVPYQETVKVIAILEAIYESSRLGREVKVKI